ncbi:MAG: hypothetical protein WC380_01995 [Pedobacter sp.]|jgi:hypothetical protein
MNITYYLLDILKYTLSGLIIFFTAWYVIKEHLSQRLNARLIDLKKENVRQTLPLRLQAYERVVLFLERVNPVNLLVRLHNPGMTARQLQHVVIEEIRAEYQHNISQQIYVSDQTWNVVKKIKEDTIALISNVANALPEDASSLELSKSVLLHLANLEAENPYDLSLAMVKKDIYTLF